MGAPSVSVVVPVYQGERFLSEALDSVLAQTHGDLEAIVADDGSTDGSLALARRFQSDPRVRVLALPHRGLSATRNAAIEEARAPLLAFLDADDVWERDMLRTQVETLAGRTGVFVYASGVRFGEGPDEPFHPPGYVPAKTFADLFPGKHVASPGAVLARRADVRAVGGFPESASGPIVEDVALWLSLARAGVLPVFNPHPGLRYRRHPGQMTRAWATHLEKKLATRLLFRDATAGDPPRRLIDEAAADAAIAEIEIDLAQALAGEDPDAAEAVLGSALRRRPSLASDPRPARIRRKARRARIAAWPGVGPLARLWRRVRGRG